MDSPEHRELADKEVTLGLSDLGALATAKPNSPFAVIRLIKETHGHYTCTA